MDAQITTITRIVPTAICADAPNFAKWNAQFEANWPPTQPDRITWMNTRDLFAFKGGENGVFLRISATGHVELGFYMDAWGTDVTSGMFMVNQEAQYPSHAEALAALLALGLQPILNQVPAYMLRS